uniref:Uncharacterized protein n=1 Tax=Chrysotila carterae TaxID=13221 RepID=A0A7S4B1Z4_CHRCT|mmetsp:Transcript_21796/g.46046  ORF Transcript_21796/g.46046 Transcript_21796/m.46046 type:complete len:416 (-) Transcript_21796:787-2034(-)
MHGMLNRARQLQSDFGKSFQTLWQITCGLLCVPLLLGWFLLSAIVRPALQLLRTYDRSLQGAELDAADAGCLAFPLLLLEVPLAVLSYLTYIAFKVPFVAFIDKQHNPASAQERQPLWLATQAKSLVNNDFHSTLAILYNLCVGPRWNTHTSVHWCFVKLDSGSADFELENIQMNGCSWQAIWYGPSHETIASCTASADEGEWVKVHVQLNKSSHEGIPIRIGLRMYLHGTTTNMSLPRVRVDGVELKPGRERVVFAKSENLAFNYLLREKQTLLHLALQWHVYTMLCCRLYLPASLVRTVYLPVGNPETQWLYGPIKAGYSLCFSLQGSVLTEHLVFCTVYSRASMPTQPCIEIKKTDALTEASREDGFWATRVVRMDGRATHPMVLDLISVSLVKVGASVKKARGIQQPRSMM